MKPQTSNLGVQGWFRKPTPPLEHRPTEGISWEQERVLRDLPRRPRKVLEDDPLDAHSLCRAQLQLVRLFFDELISLAFRL